jgi:hypothetical protein
MAKANAAKKKMTALPKRSVMPYPTLAAPTQNNAKQANRIMFFIPPSSFSVNVYYHNRV